MKLASNVRNDRYDQEAVAQAFESTGVLPDWIIAQQLRAGGRFDLERLASRLESLASKPKRPMPAKPLPLWMVKAALRVSRGMTIHAAIGATYPYGEDARVRAYHRQLSKDFPNRSRAKQIAELKRLWPGRVKGRFPEIERGIIDTLTGKRVPLQVRTAMARKHIRK